MFLLVDQNVDKIKWSKVLVIVFVELHLLKKFVPSLYSCVINSFFNFEVYVKLSLILIEPNLSLPETNCIFNERI